jgi:hypothetical protein
MARRKKHHPLRHPRRRGVVLLIIISVLVLFMLMLVTFAVVTSHYRDAARSFAQRQVLNRSDATVEVDTMMVHLLSGSENPYSSLFSHDLLSDLYGYGKSVRGQVSNVQAAGPFIQFDGATLPSPVPYSSNPRLSNIDGYHAGCVLTMIDGPCAGQSTRITVSNPYDPDNINTNVFFRAEPFENGMPANGNHFVINGRPFSGTGLGSPADGSYANDLMISSGPAALLPRIAGWPTLPVNDRASIATALAGGVNEPWDAFDFQNMFLTAVEVNVAGVPTTIYPAFHRPDLIGYWQQQVPELATDPTSPQSRALWRQISFRPLGGPNNDHPFFTGSNPSFDPINGPWDIDNDGDGIPDSIWIDPGLPISTTPDGRKFKRLVAVMVRDLDSRIDLNAQGHPFFVSGDESHPSYQISGSLAGSPGNVALPRGLGFGPAEIQFRHLFNSDADYRSIFQGLVAVPGRYGIDGSLPGGPLGPEYWYRRPGLRWPEYGNDALAAAKMQGYDLDYWSGGASLFSSPSDVWGRGAIGLDHNGQPMAFNHAMPTDWRGDGAVMTPEIMEHPYEGNLYDLSTSVDMPYTHVELERVLRTNDPDVNMLPERLANFLNGTPLTANRKAQLFTTISSHIPTPGSGVPEYMRRDATALSEYGDAALNYHIDPTILGIARARVRKALRDADPMGPPPTESAIQFVMRQTMPFEFFKGQRFDLNRPFGNAIDDNGNGVVDEPGEIDSTLSEPLNDMADYWVNMSPVPPIVLTKLQQNPHLYARQLYARNLYCLLRLVSDPLYYGQFQNEGLTDPQKFRLYCRRLAQYAINVVDARDSDSIMTPFEYDENPFDGWDVDGDPGTIESIPGRGLVWGMEYPDLQITETLAFHNRGVKDTAHDANQEERFDSTGMEQDPDLDQYRIPQGTLLFELLCARNAAGNNPKLPPELYNGAGQLDLGRLAPRRTWNMNQIRHPVWRAVVATNPLVSGVETPVHDLTTNPLTADSATFNPNALGSIMERIIWFSPHNPVNTPEQNFVFFERTHNLVNPGTTPPAQPVASTMVVNPGQCAVIAPRPDTRLGSLNVEADGDATLPDPSPLSFQVAGGLFSTAGGLPAQGFTPYPRDVMTNGPIKPVVGAVCAAAPPATWSAPNQTRQIGINISEPMPNVGAYYDEPPADRDYYADLSAPFAAGTNEVPDQPFDDDPAYDGPLADHPDGVRTGTRENFRSIYVQRLANPLLPWNPSPDDPQFGVSGSLAVAYDASLAVNPYITIDWNTLDLTVFSGDEDTSQQSSMGEWLDPSDPDPFDSAPEEKFAGRERGRYFGDTRFWANSVRDLPDTPADSGSNNQFFHCVPNHTLGYLNSNMGPRHTPEPGYEGSPANPFPWLGIENRLFANPAELLAVPASSSARLGAEFAFGNAAVGSGTPSPYATNLTVPSLIDEGRIYSGRYRHLLNFFHAEAAIPGLPTGDLYRVFELVETPSPYAAAERWYPANQTQSPNPIGRDYRPLFNKLSRFRDPGRINPNTMTDPEVWNSITATFPALQGKWDEIVRSRRGYGSSNNIFELDPYSPTIMGNPFRPADAYDLMPTAELREKPVASSEPLRPVDVTLLRSELDNPNVPLFQQLNGQAHRATDRNAYFHYQPYAKLANMLTTNSNTFAVWVTVGYFEVEPNPTGVDLPHPDGYRLREELHWESGGVRRPRAFYIIDRSIPVGFEPGHAHNVDRCILQRRYLETY